MKTIWAILSPVFYFEGGVAEIDEDHLDLAPVIGVYGPGRVEDGDPELGGKAGSRPHLRLITDR